MKYKKGKEKIWKWTFYYSNNELEKQGIWARKGTFLGTRSEFDEWEEKTYSNGQVMWLVKIHDMTEEDYKNYLSSQRD